MGKTQHFFKNKNLECLKCLMLYENLDLVILVAKIIIHLLMISSLFVWSFFGGFFLLFFFLGTYHGLFKKKQKH